MQRQRGQVLIILFVGTLLFGASAGGLNAVFDESSLKSMRKELKVLIAEKERRQRLDRILAEMQDSGKRFAGERERHGDRLLALMSQHETAPAEVERLLADADSTNLQFRHILLGLRDELRASMSSDEWRALFKPASAPAPR